MWREPGRADTCGEGSPSSRKVQALSVQKGAEEEPQLKFPRGGSEPGAGGSPTSCLQPQPSPHTQRPAPRPSPAPPRPVLSYSPHPLRLCT